MGIPVTEMAVAIWWFCRLGKCWIQFEDFCTETFMGIWFSLSVIIQISMLRSGLGKVGAGWLVALCPAMTPTPHKFLKLPSDIALVSGARILPGNGACQWWPGGHRLTVPWTRVTPAGSTCHHVGFGRILLGCISSRGSSWLQIEPWRFNTLSH